ncbi:carbohydrate ABC transporter permease [Paenibacillus chungangensis]|uniref:Carbohydrate ABC transporter permease n=1 Tax=Paenibacillus chungangensis TaxID=696535 RepID=A0ABW3HW08_9BACL
MNLKKWRLSDIFYLLPGFSIYSIFFLIPIGICLYYSFTNWNGISDSYRFVGLDNFKLLFDDRFFIEALQTTLWMTLLFTLTVNVAGILIAAMLNNRSRAAKYSKTLFFIPAILSSVVVSFIWSYMTQTNGGIINLLLELVNIPPVDMFKTPLTITFMLSFVISWAAIGFYMTIYDTSIKSIPEELYEAAKVDGAGVVRQFFRITLPLLVPGITISSVFAIIFTLKQYDFVKIMTPGNVQTIAVYAVEQAFSYNMIGYSSAIVLALFVMIVIISGLQIFILRKYKVEM